MLRRLCIASCLCFQVALALPPGFSISGDASRPECREAIKLAKAAYYSTSLLLEESKEIPKDLQWSFVNWRGEVTENSEEGLVDNKEVVEQQQVGHGTYDDYAVRRSAKLVS